MDRKRQSLKMLVPALGMSLVLAAHAQGSAGGSAGQPVQQPRAAQQQGQQPAAGAGLQAGGTQPGQARSQQRHDHRLSQLIGMGVRGSAGESLGEINDVIIDLNENRAMYAVVGFGGMLGMGERLFAFPLQAFQRSAGGDRQLVLNVPRERLKESPGFDRNQWPDWNDTAYRGQIDRYHQSGAGGPGQPGMGIAPAAVREPAEADNAAGVATRQRMQRMVRGSDLLERNVRGSNGENLGEVEDVVVNLANGRLRYAVIGFNQGWFQPDQLVAVPIDALSRSPRHPEDVVLNATREQLAQVPVFRRDQWPDVNDERHRSAWDRSLSAFRPGDPARGAAGERSAGAGAATGTTTGTIGGAATGTTGTTGTVNSRVTESTGTGRPNARGTGSGSTAGTEGSGSAAGGSRSQQ